MVYTAINSEKIVYTVRPLADADGRRRSTTALRQQYMKLRVRGKKKLSGTNPVALIRSERE